MLHRDLKEKGLGTGSYGRLNDHILFNAFLRFEVVQAARDQRA